MKTILLTIGMLLGIGLILLYQWMKPPTDDPYFFLSPKITIAKPINIPIKLYQQGDAIDVLFWMTPLPRPKLFGLLPASSPLPHVVLTIDDADKNIDFFPSRIFSGGGPIEHIGKTPIFEVKIYRINRDLTETLVLEKKHMQDETMRASAFHLVELSGPEFEYGQYRLQVKVLGDWPALKMNRLSYFITIKTYFIK